MTNRKQSITTLTFDPDKSVKPRFYSMSEGENLKAASSDSSLARKLESADSGKGLLPFCRELAGLLIRRYLIENDPAEVRRSVSRDLGKSMRINQRSAGYLIDLALELIHLKVHGEYCRNEIELSLLISKATGSVGDLRVN